MNLSGERLTDEQHKAVLCWLNDKGAPKSCEACGKRSKWALERHVAWLPTGIDGDGDYVGFRMLVTHCVNCANARLHVAHKVLDQYDDADE